MAKTDNSKKRNWRDKYRFAIYNDKTFEEVWHVKMTRYNGFLLFSFIMVIIISVTVSVLSFTNLREFIPGYPDSETLRGIYMNVNRLDSLERELDLRDQYFRNINAIILGREPLDRVAGQDTSRDYENITFSRSEEDSLLRIRVEQEEQYNLNLLTGYRKETVSLSNIHFYPPVKGMVTGVYDPRTKHFGTDIVSSPKSVVSATLDGTVVFTGWTMETGYVIQIQHFNDLISVYKHNATLLKEDGDMVVAGESISVIGNSGEMYTSGPHLHFEIWYRGEPLNPQNYILF